MGMATGNPPYRASQEQALQVAELPECTSIKPVLARIYGNSRIDYRYMAVPDFTPEQRLEGDDNFFDDEQLLNCTKEDITRAAQELFSKEGTKRALPSAPRVKAEERQAIERLALS